MDFVDNAPLGTKIGVISFSGSSLIEQRVTDDKLSVKNAIRGVNISYIGGTNLYDALLSSAVLLENQQNKAVIILSDGQVTIGDLNQAIDYATKNGIVVHTIGIGTLLGGNASYGFS